VKTLTGATATFEFSIQDTLASEAAYSVSPASLTLAAGASTTIPLPWMFREDSRGRMTRMTGRGCLYRWVEARSRTQRSIRGRSDSTLRSTGGPMPVSKENAVRELAYRLCAEVNTGSICGSGSTRNG
jgi:hypothetical protein